MPTMQEPPREPEAPKKETAGVVCRHCGFTGFRVLDTWVVFGGIRRRRCCLNCGKERHTTER